MKQIIYITITSLVLCSCSIYSKFSTPELEQTNLCREHIIATDSFIAPPQWQQLFVDTLLQELIQIGLKNNSDIRIANLNIEKAQAALLSSKLAYIPSLNFTPDAGISSFKGNSSGWAYSLPVNAQWEVDIFGKLRNNKEMAKASLQEAKYYSNLVESQIITAIANAYRSEERRVGKEC